MACLRPVMMQLKYSSTQQTEGTGNSNHETSEDDKTYVDNIKKKILKSSLEFVIDEGWTKEALARGAQAAGYASTVHTILPFGAAHLVHYFTVSCNNKLAEQMEEAKLNSPKIATKPAKFIEDSIIDRIEMIHPHKSSWGDALATVMSTRMAVDQTSALLALADDICYYAGDQSVNIDWYTRRAVVASVYQASELHWLGDGKDTRAFTANQLQRAVALRSIPDDIASLVTMAFNILPVNWKR